MANFVVAALNKKDNYLGLMAFADTIEEANEKLRKTELLASEWTFFKICGSIEELHQHGEQVKRAKELHEQAEEGQTNKDLFLREDLKDALRWLLVGAVIWKDSGRKEHCPNQDAVGMFTTFVQARALYEFYYDKERDHPDDARAGDFCDSWEPPDSTLYARYWVPLNKRVFHLVYDRSKEQYAGASGPSGPDHLNQQVLAFARELLQITRKFVECVRPEFKEAAQSALDDSLRDAQNAAEGLGLENPRSAALRMFSQDSEPS